MKNALTGFVVAAALALGSWALYEITEMNERLARIETKIDIWHTPMPKPTVSTAMLVASPPTDPRQQIAFAQRTMVKAANQILTNETGAALKTLVVGLEETGLICRIYRDTMQCEGG